MKVSPIKSEGVLERLQVTQLILDCSSLQNMVFKRDTPAISIERHVQLLRELARENSPRSSVTKRRPERKHSVSRAQQQETRNADNKRPQVKNEPSEIGHRVTTDASTEPTPAETANSQPSRLLQRSIQHAGLLCTISL